MINRVTANGLNLPSYQVSQEVSNVRHEYITVPSTSHVSWGSYCVFDFREKSCLLHELILRFDVPALAPSTADVGGANVPRLTPAFYFFSRIELVMNNNIIDTIYGGEQFIKNQLFISDEKRKALNAVCGNYNTPVSRYQMLRDGKSYYVPLNTFFNISHMPLLYPKDDIQIRLYMDRFDNVLTTLGSVNDYSSPQIQGNLLAKITRLAPDLNNFYLSEINRKPQHYKFNELRYGTFTIIPKANSPTNLVLNSITGNVDWFVFVIRPTSNLVKDYSFSYTTPIKDFSILDATSTNITGGQPIPSDQLQQVMAKDWTVSSYLQESNNVTVSSGAYPNNFTYFYSFSSDPVDTVHTGATHNTHRFQGNEQLQINWNNDMNVGTSNTYQIDIYAYVQAIIETSPTYVKKINA